MSKEEKVEINPNNINVYVRNIDKLLLIGNTFFKIKVFTIFEENDKTYVKDFVLIGWNTKERFIGTSSGGIAYLLDKYSVDVVTNGRENFLNVEEFLKALNLEIVEINKSDNETIQKIKQRFWDLGPEEGLLESGMKEAVKIINENE